MINTIIIINGIYDIICGLNLVYNFFPPLLELHTGLFININEDIKRFLGYIILLFGIIRLSQNYSLIISSYIFEIYFFENENIYNKYGMNTIKVRIVSIMSLILAFISL